MTAAAVVGGAVAVASEDSVTERSARSAVSDAGEIARALIVDVPLLVDGAVRRVTREMVVPVTGERADVAVVGDVTWLFEIKSGRDSLRRLRRQSEAFARVGERCVLVAAERHLARAVAELPTWWGIIEVLEGRAVSLRWHRLAASNPETDRRTLLLILRRDEAEVALNLLDGQDRAKRRRMSLLAELDRRLDDDAIAECVRVALARRR